MGEKWGKMGKKWVKNEGSNLVGLVVTDVVPRRLTCLQEGPAGGVLEGQLHRAVRRDRHPRDQVRVLRAKMQLN